MVSVQSTVVGLLLVHSIFCFFIVGAEDDPYGKEVSRDIDQARKFGLLIPLLIGISTRLAAIIPTAFLGTIGIFIFVALAKKAFVISVLSFMMMWMDKRNKHMRPKIMHVHHAHPMHSFPINSASSSPSFPVAGSPSQSSFSINPPSYGSFDLDPNAPVYYSYEKGHSFASHKKPLRKWPKVDSGPWSFTSPPEDLDMETFVAQSAALHPNAFVPQTATTRHPHQYVPRLTTMDSYLPQTTRNLDSYHPHRRNDGMPPILYTPQGIFYPRIRISNSTEPPLLPNTTVGITPQLQKFIENSIEEGEDPR